MEEAVLGQYLKVYEAERNKGLRAFLTDFLMPRASITTQKLVPDFSFYQGVVNFDILINKTDSAIVRGGQGNWKDTQFTRNITEGLARNMLMGVYWFYDDRYSPGAQANALVAAIKDYATKIKLPVFIDWENSYGGNYQGIGEVVAMMQEVQRQLPNLQLGIYTGYYWFTDHTNPITNANQFAYLKDKPLWLAWYTDYPSYVRIPAPWTKLEFWQWGTPVWGIEWGMDGSKEIDMSYFNGTEDEYYQRYGSSVPSLPPVETVYDNGVKTIEGRLFESDYKIYLIPSEEILEVDLVAGGKCHTIDQFSNVQFVSNITPAPNGACVTNMGLKHNDVEEVPYVPWNPYVAWKLGQCFIDHRQDYWDTFPTATQGYRYLIHDGKLGETSPDWDLIEPRKLFGRDSLGRTFIISCKGRKTGEQRGWDLHEAAELGFALGLEDLVDFDGGKSVNEILHLEDGTDIWFSGTGDNEPLPVFLTMKFKNPLVQGVPMEAWTGTMLRKVGAFGRPTLDPPLVARTYKKGTEVTGELETITLANGNELTFLVTPKGKFIPVREKDPAGNLLWKHVTLKK